MTVFVCVDGVEQPAARQRVVNNVRKIRERVVLGTHAPQHVAVEGLGGLNEVKQLLLPQEQVELATTQVVLRPAKPVFLCTQRHSRVLDVRLHKVHDVGLHELYHARRVRRGAGRGWHRHGALRCLQTHDLLNLQRSPFGVRAAVHRVEHLRLAVACPQQRHSVRLRPHRVLIRPFGGDGIAGAAQVAQRRDGILSGQHDGEHGAAEQMLHVLSAQFLQPGFFLFGAHNDRRRGEGDVDGVNRRDGHYPRRGGGNSGAVVVIVVSSGRVAGRAVVPQCLGGDGHVMLDEKLRHYFCEDHCAGLNEEAALLDFVEDGGLVRDRIRFDQEKR
eukprot:PhM_4_TR9512/c0_g1_i1/m.57730